MTRRLLAVSVAVLSAAAAAIGGLYAAGAFGGGRAAPSLRHVVLPPLSPGPRELVRGKYGVVLVARTSLDEMIRSAETVFVGTVEAIGGAEMLDPAIQMEAHRVRFAVERVFRGDPVDTIDVTDLVWVGALFKASVGERYLIFSEHRRLGSSRIRRLVAVGSPQGVYHVLDSNQARNDLNGTVDVDVVAARVAAAS